MDKETKNYIPRLDGVTFPSRRHTVGQAGHIVAEVCTAILQEEGSGVSNNGDRRDVNRVDTRHVKAPESAILSIIWNNPRVSVMEILSQRSPRLSTG